MRKQYNSYQKVKKCKFLVGGIDFVHTEVLLLGLLILHKVGLTSVGGGGRSLICMQFFVKTLSPPLSPPPTHQRSLMVWKTSHALRDIMHMPFIHLIIEIYSYSFWKQ